MSFIQNFLIFGFICAAFLWETGDAVQCLLCNDVSNMTECSGNVIDCGQGQQCFLEETITDSNQIVFNAGCRSDGVCQIMQSLSGIGKRNLDRKQRAIVSCASCCNSPADQNGPCNGKLCGQTPLIKRPSMCLDCTSKASADACTTKRACQETQVCGNEIIVEGGRLVRYNFYCEEKHLCHTAYLDLARHPAGGRKRALTGHSGGVAICNSCCTGNECNKADCYILQKNFTAADFA